ncbi:MAG: hypothetical protein WA705_08925 [Candidatus Ozemobacteraceae bacterium]
MKPLAPCRFRNRDLGNGFRFEGLENGLDLQNHLVRTGADFPSLIFAYAARGGVRSIATLVAQGLNSLGLNVFQPKSAVPLAALSAAVAKRNIPIGLYLDEDDAGFWTLTPLAAHGGPVEHPIFEGGSPVPLKQTGVLGETEIIEPYLRALEGLLDATPGEGPRLAGLDCPFPEIDRRLLDPNDPASRTILGERRPDGPHARISPDGQGLEIEWPIGKRLSTDQLVQMVGRYLHEQRAGRGTLIGPPGARDVVQSLSANPEESEKIEVIEVRDGPLEMSYRAGFSDLLLGWWDSGILAHQGHGPFGDGLLTLAYLLESWSS